ncbi:hypothetical protein MPER_06967 [Moniliophthora perniciosa FA553]|nr:hypothetical protein MPER_06967 [Moniliophthora perniciosa FA553]
MIIHDDLSIIIPWCTVREVKVETEIPSPKVVILKFERGMQHGLLARISRSSVMEYHAFGIISEGVNSRFENPPTHIWTRQLKRGIRVCTGTGLEFGLRGGRPDTMKLIRETFKSWNAEVVFITSNWIGNTEMMEGCKKEGIPAFGTLWDF